MSRRSDNPFQESSAVMPNLDRLAFPKLNKLQIAELEPFGKYEDIRKGENVWEAGTPNLCMFIVLKGTISVQDGRSGTEIARHVPGGFSGDIDIISGRPTMVTGIALTNIRVLILQGDCVRQIVGVRPEIGEILFQAFLRRRGMLQERTDVGVKVIGSRYSSETVRIREFLSRCRIVQSWDDLEVSHEINALLQEFGVSEDDTPVVILPNGKLLRSPSNSELGKELGVISEVDEAVYDLVVVGAGPAGLAAAVYGASEGLSTLVIDAEAPGGQAGTSSKIENYMGFPLGIRGQDLADRAVNQAEKFGARFVVPACVLNVTCAKHGIHVLTVDTIGEVSTRCVILAPGASYRKLEVDNLAHFENRGVYYAATHIEQLYCTEEVAIVVGGGNSAGQAAIYMAQKAKKVYLVVRADDLRKGMSAYLAKRIENSDKIEVLVNSEICSLEGEHHISTATIADKKSGKKLTVGCAGVFVMIGAVPHTDWLPPQIATDAKGFILTGQSTVESEVWKENRSPFFLETSCPGIFCAGDARSGSVKRVASSVGEGSMAVALIHQFLTL